MLKRNLIANYLGSTWSAAMSFVFVPVYIRYLGIEAYGVVGMFALLTTWLALLDMGTGTTLSREMSRFTAGQVTVIAIRDLLRTAEALFAVLALVIMSTLGLGSQLLAEHWLNVERLPPHTVRDAICVMGVVLALRFFEGIYRSSLGGLQRQVPLNIVSTSVATMRGVGAYVVLATVSPTVTAFFAWQVLTSIVSLGCMMFVTYRVLPRTAHRARVSLQSVREVRGFAGGVFALTGVSLLLSQFDKILLSKLLPLSAFGHYSFAATVAGTLFFLVTPISQSWYPRLCELHATGDQQQFVRTYHNGAQLTTVIVGCASAMLIFFSDSLLLLWTGDPMLTSHVAPLVSLLAFGNLLNGLMVLPYQVQLAHGWTSMLLRYNMVALLLLAPVSWVLIRHAGGLGAAAAWVALNVSYFILLIPRMHRRIMPLEKRRWYMQDVGYPLCSAFSVAGLAKLVMPTGLSTSASLIYIVVAGLFSCAAAVASTEYCRVQLTTRFNRRERPIPRTEA